MIRGPISSAASSRKKSSRPWASAVPFSLCDYPASEAALARIRTQIRAWPSVFELYACGVELVNAFGELTTPTNSAPLREDMRLKQMIYGKPIPSTRIFSTHWRTCRKLAARRSDSTG